MDAITTTGAVFVAKFVENLSKDMASFLTNKVKGYFDDTTKKELIDSGWAFEDYLTRAYERYSKSKSILYGSEARNLSSFYVPIDITLQYDTYNRQKGGLRRVCYYTNNRLSTKEISAILEKGHKLIITGVGGMGKTMLMKHFCVNAIETGCKIPVFISLRWFNDDIEEEPFEKMLYKQLQNFGFELPYEYFKYSLDGDKYIFLFDGYDEICEEKITSVSLKLEEFTIRYADNYFIMSSRPNENLSGWEDFKIYKISPLTHEQGEALINRLDFDEDLKQRFIDELNDNLFYKYESFTSVPLLLSILFLTYDATTIIPETLNEFYEKAFDTMLFKHDRMKVGFTRVFKTGLSYVEFRDIFVRFCFRTYFKNVYSFSYNDLILEILCAVRKTNDDIKPEDYLNDLVSISSMVIKDGSEYIFIHRCFQEYFAAIYVSQQIEIKQVKLCSAFIQYSLGFLNEKGRYAGIHHIGFSQCIEFLSMLCHIEPNRFEYVVLQPIREKIVLLYNRCEKNLLLTASKIFFIEKGILDDGETEKVESTWYLTNVNYSEHGISAGELVVLDYFHWELENKDQNKKDVEIEKITDAYRDSLEGYLFNNIDFANAVIVESHTIQTDKENIVLGTSEVVLTYLFEEIARYEDLIAQSKPQSIWQEIIDDF